MKIKMMKIFIFLICTVSLSAAGKKNIEEENNAENINKPVKERGIDRLNFYIPIKEKNKFSMSGEFEIRPDKNIYQWTMGEGYIDLGERWDFNYRIEKEFHEEKKRMKANYKVWDNDIFFTRLNDGFKIGEKQWSYRTLFGIKHSENEARIFKNDRIYKYYIGQRISVFSNKIGMGGTYIEAEGLVNGIAGAMRNGYSIQASLKSGSALGYGFQWNNILESEYMDYNQFEGAVRSKVESVFRWTYELGKNWAFSPEVNLKFEKYFSMKDNNYIIESTAGPYILYSHELNENTRILGKIGPVYRYERSRYGDMTDSKSHFTGYAKIGIEYIF